MTCTLCGQPLRHRGPTMHSIWMEMESEVEMAVVVHRACAWAAIRDSLYRREQRGEFKEGWTGWEPMDWQNPYEVQ